MHRFFSPHPLTTEIRIPQGDQFHQIFHVFRSKPGESIIFFESGGDDVIYEIVEVNKKEAFLKKKKVIEKPRIQEPQMELFQAYPNKISTMEIVVQKMVELGVSKITFFPSQHSQVKDIPDIKKSRLSHIATEALEQSGGNTLLDIVYESNTIESMLHNNANLSHVVGSIGGNGLEIWDTSGLWFWVGPEGWWSQTEKDIFIKNRCILWSFNTHILRLETASIVGVGILNYLSQVQE